MNKHSPPRERGFVLVIVLAVLVVLTLLATAVATSAERAIAAAQADADRFQSELATAGTRDTVLFLLLTQRQTLAGVTVNASDTATSTTPPEEDANGFNVLPVGNEIRLDGTPYQGLESSRFALQDDHGLLSANWAAPFLRFALYKKLGARDTDWDGLDAKRLDYQDPDDLHRLNGAEKAEYARAGLPPPSNRALASPLELRKIPGWNKLLAPLDDTQLLSTFTLSRSVDLNINTAPAHVLALLPGLTEKNATRMTEVRRLTPFLSVIEAQETFGIGVAPEGTLTLFAIPSGNLILWDQHSGARQLLHWTLTPLEADGPPWRIDYEVTLPRGNESDQTVVGTPATPLFTAPDPSGKQR